ncbi:MAG: HAMP domain-containing histidine kinase [Cyanobacteria bacterium]|nr:HAMP domain-containing histidine kinase [Cyanobacteriota bacterium]
MFRADAAIKREDESKQVIYSASNMIRRSVDCATAVAIYNFTREQSYRDKVLKSVKELESDIQLIAKKVKGNRDQLRRLNACKTAFLQVGRALDRLLYKIDNNTEDIKVFATNTGGLRSERQLLTALSKRSEELIDAERTLCDSFVKQERKARELLVGTIIVGIALNIILALSSSIYFFRNISSRIEKLIRNTSLITERNVAAETIEGTDEIAELDKAFHKAVGELQSSEEMRRQLVAMVSHDLRSPLTSVDAALTLINEGVLGTVPEEVVKVSKNAAADVNRLVRLTNDLLDAERLISGDMKLRCRNVSASALLSEACDAVRLASQQSNIELVVNCPEFAVFADPDRINQVLCNLVGNAIKFSESGSLVLLEAEPGEAFHEFRVTDSGCGIESESQAYIFERFTRLDDNSDGKGLGLAICKALVELHGGEIGVRSRPKEGATFWFKLPVVPE